MIRENKKILLKDLCARLPYGIKCTFNGKNIYKVYGIDEVVNDDGDWEYAICTKRTSPLYISDCKPYLFPISSMTEEQKKELENLGWNFDNFEINNVTECLGTYREFVTHSDCFILIDWCYKNHIDINNLIPMGLANDATGLNIY